MKQQINNTALYLRLSRDDENYGDSVSIETQRTILRQFVKDNGFHVVDEYVDDGWTGTNFDRPAFKRMIEDVESGRINCIITKDLSRFGREHVMMGYYLEFYFVEKNVRYIAVSDGEDTEKGLSDFVPFKNLFNEWYAKDTSRKIKASMNAKFKAGERTCAYAPVGYKKHPEIKERYRRINSHRGHKKAIIAVCRMLLTAIWHILSDLKPYTPDGYLTPRPVVKEEKVLTTSQALNLLKLRGYVIKDDVSAATS